MRLGFWPSFTMLIWCILTVLAGMAVGLLGLAMFGGADARAMTKADLFLYSAPLVTSSLCAVALITALALKKRKMAVSLFYFSLIAFPSSLLLFLWLVT